MGLMETDKFVIEGNGCVVGSSYNISSMTMSEPSFPS